MVPNKAALLRLPSVPWNFKRRHYPQRIKIDNAMFGREDAAEFYFTSADESLFGGGAAEPGAVPDLAGTI